MAIIYLLNIFLFIEVSYTQKIFIPQYKANNKYPFLLPYSDNDYYYLITSNKGLKIKRDDGNINEMGYGLQYSNEAIFCVDIFNNSYIYFLHKLYSIILINLYRFLKYLLIHVVVII